MSVLGHIGFVCLNLLAAAAFSFARLDDADLAHTARISLKHVKLITAGGLHHFAARRDAPEHGGNQTAQRIHVLSDFAHHKIFTDDPLDHQFGKGQPMVGFAIWDGTADNVGARKHFSMWTPFERQP